MADRASDSRATSASQPQGHAKTRESSVADLMICAIKLTSRLIFQPFGKTITPRQSPHARATGTTAVPKSDIATQFSAYQFCGL